MKIELTFHLPEDEDNLHMAQRGPDYLFALQDFAKALRNGLKYKDKEWEEVSDIFYKILDDANIDVWGEVQ